MQTSTIVWLWEAGNQGFDNIFGIARNLCIILCNIYKNKLHSWVRGLFQSTISSHIVDVTGEIIQGQCSVLAQKKLF